MVNGDDDVRVRLWITSVFIGSIVSCTFTALMWLTRATFYFPPVWPGLLLAWIVVIASHGQHWADRFGVTLLTLGNTVFYAWLSFRVMKAEVASRGRLSRYFVR